MPGIIRTAVKSDLSLELDYREPSNGRADVRPRGWAVNSEEYFEKIQALIARDFERLLHQM
jgi:hypothetical protein